MCCCKWINFWITKSVASYFYVTTRLELFSTEFLVFLLYVCYAQNLISSRCWVVVCCLCYYRLLIQEFCLGCKHHSFVDFGLLKKFFWRFWCFCIFFSCTTLRGWTQTGPSPWNLEVARRTTKMFKKHKRKALGLVKRGPLLLFFIFISYFSPLSLPLPFFFSWYFVGITTMVVAKTTIFITWNLNS